MISFVPPNKPLNLQTRKTGLQISGFLPTGRAHSHLGALPLRLPAMKRLPPNHSFPLPSCWALLQESPEGPSSKSGLPPTVILSPLPGLSFSLKFFRHIILTLFLFVSFHDNVSTKRTGLFVSFVLCYNPDIWNGT